MTDLSEKIVEAGARAMRNSKAWPEVFSPGSAELLTRAALLAVLPMVAEEMARVAGRGGSPEAPTYDELEAEVRISNAIRARFSSLIEDLKT